MSDHRGLITLINNKQAFRCTAFLRGCKSLLVKGFRVRLENNRQWWFWPPKNNKSRAQDHGFESVTRGRFIP